MPIGKRQETLEETKRGLSKRYAQRAKSTTSSPARKKFAHHSESYGAQANEAARQKK